MGSFQTTECKSSTCLALNEVQQTNWMQPLVIHSLYITHNGPIWLLFKTPKLHAVSLLDILNDNVIKTALR